MTWICSGLFKKAYESAFIKQGFKACGIYPLDQNAIPKEAVAPSIPTEQLENVEPTSTASSTVIQDFSPEKNVIPETTSSCLRGIGA